MAFAQVVVGPPGSGKTTYCAALKEFYTGIKRPYAVVNLDFGNDSVPFDVDVDVRDLITLDDIMEEYKLGPNGALIFGMEFLEKNLEWLEGRIKEVLQKDRGRYLIFDCPGQVELYVHHQSTVRILRKLAKSCDLRPCCVHLVEATYISDGCKYISMLLLSLQVMLNLEMPHVNVLSKADVLKSFSERDFLETTSSKTANEVQSYSALAIELPFDLEEYTSAVNLVKLLDLLNSSPFGQRYKSLNRALCDLIEDFSLVNFQTLAVESKRSMASLQAVVDKANGYYDITEDVELTESEQQQVKAAIDERLGSAIGRV